MSNSGDYRIPGDICKPGRVSREIAPRLLWKHHRGFLPPDEIIQLIRGQGWWLGIGVMTWVGFHLNIALAAVEERGRRRGRFRSKSTVARRQDWMRLQFSQRRRRNPRFSHDAGKNGDDTPRPSRIATRSPAVRRIGQWGPSRRSALQRLRDCEGACRVSRWTTGQQKHRREGGEKKGPVSRGWMKSEMGRRVA